MKKSIVSKRILRELGNNARLSYKELSKRINSKKEIVAYHINKMEKEGTIKKYNTVFSQAKLGVFCYKIYLRFQGLTEDKEEEMIDKFNSSPYVNWIARSLGTWDLMLAFYCRNVLEFSKRKKDLVFVPYGKFIQDYTVSILDDCLIYSRDYLPNAVERGRPGLIYGGVITEEKIDLIQREIIRFIRVNGRYEVAELARKLGKNVKTVVSKIKNLERRGIVQGAVVIVDHEKLGVQYFKIQISFQDHSEEKYKKVLSYCKANTYVVNLMNSVGDWEIELEAEAETVEELFQFAKDLRTNFPAIIKKVVLHKITEEIKVDYLPEWF